MFSILGAGWRACSVELDVVDVLERPAGDVVRGVVLLEPVGDGAVAASLVGVEHRVDVAAGELDADGADAGVALPAALGALEAVGGELGALAAGEPLTGLVQRGLAALLRA